MKLNHECVRDLMLYIEENLEYGYLIKVNDVKIKDYSQDEIIYAADKLLEAGYLDGQKIVTLSDKIPEITITSITWNGHQFLDNIRDNKVWEHTKSILSKFSSVSINIISNVAAQVISNLIKTQVGL
ncbi:MAG: DUF2513 domain-containing protein [Tissierellales bacterium]